MKELKKNNMPIEIEVVKRPNSKEYKLFKEYAPKISKYFQLKGQYYRLTLNNPSQGLAAHQTKKAVTYLFNYIKKNNHLWKARIANVIHDEICLEVTKDLSKLYAQKVGEFMVQAGNELLPNKHVEMKAEGHVGKTWYEAK